MKNFSNKERPYNVRVLDPLAHLRADVQLPRVGRFLVLDGHDRPGAGVERPEHRTVRAPADLLFDVVRAPGERAHLRLDHLGQVVVRHLVVVGVLARREVDLGEERLAQLAAERIEERFREVRLDDRERLFLAAPLRFLVVLRLEVAVLHHGRAHRVLVLAERKVRLVLLQVPERTDRGRRLGDAAGRLRVPHRSRAGASAKVERPIAVVTRERDVAERRVELRVGLVRGIVLLQIFVVVLVGIIILVLVRVQVLIVKDFPFLDVAHFLLGLLLRTSNGRRVRLGRIFRIARQRQQQISIRSIRRHDRRIRIVLLTGATLGHTFGTLFRTVFALLLRHTAGNALRRRRPGHRRRRSAR